MTDPDPTEENVADVEALLRAHKSDPQVRSALGRDRVGPYRLLEPIGEGGMGTVWLAEQEPPMRRRVALKLIRPGQTSPEFLARFDVERQALAALQHPNIAQIHDAGTTPDGLPFYSMEFVPGLPITEFCDRHRLSLKERVELFHSVCLGMQHAHQKGIIHRDLKPTNILVATVDGKPRPKIIDFGIAKAQGYCLTDQPLHTEMGRVLGTPEYMSPEQADSWGEEVDTRTDVYALGVILYEVLVGVRPYEVDRSGIAAMQRTIRETPSPRPSSRITGLGETAVRIAKARRTDPPDLARKLRGDLDLIVDKALNKDKDQRYPSVSHLAQDLEAFLQGEPISVRPHGAGYHLRRAVQKYRRWLAAAGAFVLLLAGALVVTTILYARMDQAYRRALPAEVVGRLWALREEAVHSFWPPYLEAPGNVVLKIPAGAETMQEAMRRWEQRLATLQSEMEPRLQARAEELRRIGRVLSDGEREKERELKARQADLANKQALVEWLAKRPEYAEERKKLEEQIAKDAASALPEMIVFDRCKDPFDLQWQFELVKKAQGAWAEFKQGDRRESVFADMKERIRFAREIDEKSRSSAEAKAAWSKAIAEIRISESYNGLILAPQIGLFPLGANEHGYHEFWHLQSGDRPEPRTDPGKHGRWLVTEKTGIILVLLPGGTFAMGSEAFTETRPVHQVHLAPFFLSRYEMTQAQWTEASRKWHGYVNMQRNPSFNSDESTKADDPVRPVNQMNWGEADHMLRCLGLMLPTEAQWEYAATNNGVTEMTEWLVSGPGEPGSLNPAQRVDSHPPGRLGLHHMLGNVSEFCLDDFSLDKVHGMKWAGYQLPTRPEDGKRQVVEGGTYAVRGGNCMNLTPRGVRLDLPQLSFTRAYCGHRQYSWIGLRPARGLDGGPGE